MKSSFKVVFRKTMMRVLCLSVLFIQLNLQVCYGERRPNMSARKVLEYSLLSLQNSAQEVAKKNQWIVEENKKLRDNIRTLSTEIMRLEEDKMKWIVQNASFEDVNVSEKELLLFKEKANGLTDEVSRMAREQQDLERKLSVNGSKEKEALHTISKVNKEIIDIQNKIAILDSKNNRDVENNSEKQLLRQIKESEDEIVGLQKQLLKIRNSNMSPLAEVQELSNKRSLLKQQLLIIEDELKIISEEERTVQEEILNVSKEKEGRKEELLKEIKNLNDQKDSLNTILDAAKEKLKVSNFDLVSSEGQERQLRENLVTIKNENKMLTKKVSELQAEVQKIKGN